jgi:plastocyanin
MRNRLKVTSTCFFLIALAHLFLATRAFSYDEVAVSNGGTIKGTVRFAGNLPKLAPPTLTKFKEVCQGVPNESLVTGAGQGIRYAIVSLDGITKGRPIEREVLHEIDNVKCRFAPHVIVAEVGQFVLFKNSDPILHTAHALFKGDQPQFNVGLYPGRVSRKPLTTPGIVKIICEVHPWMSAYVGVGDHPYHAVTDAYGEYLIQDVPPGVYQLRLWHETLGLQENKVEVKAGTISQVDFVLSENGKGKK